MNPEQAASRSNAAARIAPIFCLHQARRRREGHVGRDGGDDDQVNLLGGDLGAFACARFAASAARSEVNSSSRAMRRSLMPVRLVIQSSVVSTIFSNSALVRIRAGT